MNELNFGETFSRHTASVDDVLIHYTIGGQGDPLVLLHGFPQHSYMWRKVMPALAERFTVIAPDQKGMGGSSIPAAGYDKKTMAKDIHGLVQQLGFGEISLVGYDLGGGTAYAYASEHPDEVKRLAILEYSPAGFGYEQGMQPTRDWQSWQLAFFTVPDIAVQFMQGKERELLAWYFWHWSYDPGAIDTEDFEVYLRQLQKPGALRSGFEYFASVFDDTDQFEKYAESKLKMPVLALGGERGAGEYPMVSMQQLAEDVRGGTVEHAGHWLADERPDHLANQLLTFFGE